ncbi:MULTISPECIES: hypothetical protein [Virgibacillus]|nr:MULTISPECIES: hypothetical protein [Virgibacillus]MBS7427783.1 hypothetical protein [Virgibacillus sp. 19R1-5]MBU8568750.1 hypothetical protein [Virgibacillus pantothenticus]MBU8602831.1 hypothetical protein [Virgibacillus pantothenticus]MBU8636881.1 hypothetical protein [Virgibacillus pantothenticus]MBU8644413.1 hypothetical protein [Virgibacillus pantothenticus]
MSNRSSIEFKLKVNNAYKQENLYFEGIMFKQYVFRNEHVQYQVTFIH